MFHLPTRRMASRPCLLLSVFFAFAALVISATATASTDEKSKAIQWRVTVLSRNKKRVLLDKVTGSSSKGALHAIIGLSGSGKTTLLNILAGTVSKGSVYVEGTCSSSFADSPVYVQQEDLLFSQLTVRETLLTSVSLRSAADNTAAERAAIVDRLIMDLGLKKVMGELSCLSPHLPSQPLKRHSSSRHTRGRCQDQRSEWWRKEASVDRQRACLGQQRSSSVDLCRRADLRP